MTLLTQEAKDESKIKGHVSRVAITNSREDLTKEPPKVPEVEPEDRKVTKISIQAQPHQQTQQVEQDPPNQIPQPKISKSPPKKPARAKASQSVENITTLEDETPIFDDTVNSGHLTPNAASNKANTIHTPRTPSSKPRAGRKRWAFNFGGSKTGSLKSLKSVKSAGGEEDDDKK